MFQSWKIVSQSSINWCLLFLCLINLQAHLCIYLTGLPGAYFIIALVLEARVVLIPILEKPQVPNTKPVP